MSVSAVGEQKVHITGELAARVNLGYGTENGEYRQA